MYSFLMTQQDATTNNVFQEDNADMNNVGNLVLVVYNSD